MPFDDLYSRTEPPVSYDTSLYVLGNSLSKIQCLYCLYHFFLLEEQGTHCYPFPFSYTGDTPWKFPSLL